MTDTFSKEDRSRIMKSVRSVGNLSTELGIVRLFRIFKIAGWRRHFPIAGKPDFAFPRHKIAVFVDGCFWHGCPAHLRMPSSNLEYWQRKISRNKERDKKVARELKGRGWKVIRIWEHDIKSAPARIVKRISSALAKAERSNLSGSGGNDLT